MLILTFYNFGVSAFATENLSTDDIQVDIEDIPISADFTQDFYYQPKMVGAIGSALIGGSGIMGAIASLPLASFAVGALTVGYGVYSLVNGVKDMIDVYNSIDKHPVSNSTDYEVDAVSGAISFTPSESNKSKYLESSISAHNNVTTLSSSPTVGATFQDYSMISDVDNVSITDFRIFSTGSYFVFKASPGYHFKIRVGDYYYFIPKFKIYFQSKDSGRSNYIESSEDGFKVSALSGSISNLSRWTKLATFDDSFDLSPYVYKTSHVFDSFGVEVVGGLAYERVSQSIKQSLALSSFPTLTIPQNHVQLANPDLTFENGNWVNKDGNVATDEEIKVFIPNTFNPSTGGLEWDSTYEGALGGTLNPPIEDVTPDNPTLGGNWLTSILNAITSLPSLIFEAFMGLLNSILDGVNAIPGALNDILTWCRDLPNFLSDCLSSVIEFLQSLGMTLSDILEFIISLPLTLVEMLVEGLVLVFDALFIPSDDFFKNNFEDIKDNFSSKFPIFLQFKDMFNSLKFNESSRPEINITLPEILGGGTYALIDYDVFDHFRPYLLNMLTLVFYFFFGMSIFRNLPNVISGGGGGSEDDS